MKNFTMKSLAATTTLGMLIMGCGNQGSSSLTTQDTGSDRLAWTNKGINFESANQGQDYSAAAAGVTLSFNQTATLAPPIVNGITVQANAIEVVWPKAYVAYNTQGTGYGGGVDVIDFTIPGSPIMTSTKTYTDYDFAGLSRDGLNLYGVGSNNNGAALFRFPLSIAGNVGTSPDVISLAGQVGTGVKVFGGNIYAVTGDSGGLTVLPANNLLSFLGLMTPPAYTPIADARDISVNLNGNPHVVTGNSGASDAKVYVANDDGTLPISNSVLASITNPVNDDGKSSLISGTVFDLATAGEGGTRLVCQATGAVTLIANPTVSGLSSALTAANSASFGAGLIYVANGAAGVAVYSVVSTNIFNPCVISVTYQGRITFEDGASANNVRYYGGNLIVATGAGGFRIIGVTQSNSVSLLVNL